jgi:hypothetical protein
MLGEYREHFILTLLSTDPKVTIDQPSLANITIGESDGKKLQSSSGEASPTARSLHAMQLNFGSLSFLEAEISDFMKRNNQNWDTSSTI